MKQNKIDFLLVWATILIVVPLPLIYVFNQSILESPENVRIYDYGILAYVWWLVIVYLSTRPKWLASIISIPRMYFMHGILSIIALIFATLHKQMGFTYHAPIKLTGDIAWYLSVFGIVYAVLFMSNWLIDRIPIVMATKNNLKLILKHQVSVWIHRLHFVMIGLIWLHVHLIPRLTQLHSFLIVFDLYTLAALASYVYVKFIRNRRINSGKLIVNQRLDAKTQMITLKLTPFAPMYHAGDFYFLKIPYLSNEVHPFSVSSAPKEGKRQVSFVIQNVGDYTNKISDIPLGASVQLEGPFGEFQQTVEKLPLEQPIVLYGLGSGAAPLLSLAQKFEQRNLQVIWSARRDSHRYLDAEFNAIDVVYNSKNGRFSQKDLRMILSEEKIKNGIFIVIGGSATVLKVRNNLIRLGVSKKRLIDERLIM